MLQIVLIVLPVFLLIAAGYLAVLLRYLPVAIADALSGFAIKLAVPCLLFTAMIRINFASAFSWQILISFYVGAVVCFVSAILIARTVFKRRPGEAASVGFAATFSNSLLLGVPIVERAHGDDALMFAFGVIAVHAPILYTIGMVTMEIMRRDGKTFTQTAQDAARSIIANPLIVGITFGLLVNVSGINVPEAVNVPIQMLASAAIPAALVGMGAALTRYQVTADLPEIGVVSAFSLVIHPAIAFLLSHVIFDLPEPTVLAIVTVAAMPPGVNIYVFAALYDRAVGLAASALLIATALAMVTVSSWLYILQLSF